MVSFRMRLLKKVLLRNKGRPRELSVPSYREGLISFAKTQSNLPTDVHLTSEQVNQIPAEWIIPDSSTSDSVVLYLHGGGFVGGSPVVSRFFVAQFVKRTKIPFLIIDYALAPEKPFPHALEDAVSAYRWLLETKHISSNRIALFGESTGGNLAIAALVRLRELDFELPATAICLSPWVDLAFTGESIKSKEEIDPILTLEEMTYLAKQYIGDNDPIRPLISPLYAELHDLPPLFIQVGTSEMALDDSLRIAKKAEDAGVEVVLNVWKDMPHVFSIFFQYTPDSRKGIDRICEHINRYLQ
jgi:monoterpene epsilon-lactone hydrolase